MRIESDPRLEKGFQLCWQLSFETVQTCRDFVLLSFTVLCVYIYVYIYISINISFISFVLCVVERGFEELTQCNKGSFPVA